MHGVVLTLFLATCGTAVELFAHQPAGSVTVEVARDGRPLAGARVGAGSFVATTDATGTAILLLPAGRYTLIVSLDGMADASSTLDVAAGQSQRVVVAMDPQPTVEETVTVSATRTNNRLEDEPMRVEVLGRDEIEEKMLMTPGDIVMMLNEMGGMRVQATSPSLGAASVRIQGMRGRYTRVLSDGLPLYGQQVGGLGLLQIPPMDLGQVEVIKGVASALYGAGAMGGVVNLGSRRPGPDAAHELLLNRSTRGATDTVAFLSSPLSERWGATLLAGGHWQARDDVDDDGWSDLAGYSRAIVRPRVFWDGNDGRSFFATAGFTWEDRTGGTFEGSVLPQTQQPYIEALDTLRVDAGAVAQTILAGRFVFTSRGAASVQDHDHRFGDVRERDRHTTLFGEVALRGTAGRHTWVVGGAVEYDDYDPRDLPQFAYLYTVPGIFVHDDVTVTPWLSFAASARLDVHNEYGVFFSPRLSGLVRSGPWTMRASGGTGFFASTVLTEETEAAGLTRLILPAPLEPERGRSVSFDITRAMGAASVTVTAFGSRVVDPVTVFREQYALVNLAEPSTNAGLELLGTVRAEAVAVTGTYTYVRARENGATGGRVDSPLTPRHSAGVVGMIESERKGRLGLELYYTGRQRLEANPYRDVGSPYLIVGALGERRIGRFRLFLNAENLTGVRQTRWDPLVRPTRAVDGRWTVDAWAPLEGRVFNGGMRIEF